MRTYVIVVGRVIVLGSVLSTACGGATPATAPSSHSEPADAPVVDGDAEPESSADDSLALVQRYFRALTTGDADGLAEVIGVPHTKDSPCDVAPTREAVLQEAAQFGDAGEIDVEAVREVASRDGLPPVLARQWAQLDPELGSCPPEREEAIRRAAALPRRFLVARLRGPAVAEGTEILVRLSLIEGRWVVSGAGF